MLAGSCSCLVLLVFLLRLHLFHPVQRKEWISSVEHQIPATLDCSGMACALPSCCSNDDFSLVTISVIL
uniref:Putative secreted protein n=1 Tax=Anopheles marajoara TaxID=58244 RepID=A0A2M4CF04_9DIPT